MQGTDSNLTFLVCESDFRILHRLEQWICTMGYNAYGCSDGIEAQELYSIHKPDIVLLSDGLNSMSGLELLKAIKEKNPQQAIIFMLDESIQPSTFQQAIDLQVDKFLNKPIDVNSLHTSIQSLSIQLEWYKDYQEKKKLLEDYKDAIDLSFSVSQHDLNGKIIYVNELFCSTMQITYDEALAGKINPLCNPNEDLTQLWNALHNIELYRGRHIFEFKDGKEHIIDILVVPMFDSDDEVSDYLVFSTDVSNVVYAARKIKEQEIDQKLQKLEHAKELNRVKDSLLTVFTHELKTPLNAIINFAEYVKKHLAKEEFSKKDLLLEQTTQIYLSGISMHDMIENLIDAMRLRDKKATFICTNFALEATCQKVLLKYEYELENINIEFVHSQNCIIYSDETRMTQIINNLISNAIKYCSATIAITIKHNEKLFAIEIADDGEGFVDKAAALRLFEQASENDMTRTAKGTGVGLYVVQEICKNFGYKLEILDSKKLGGARIVIKGRRD